jgi:nicotinamidase-related amidase
MSVAEHGWWREVFPPEDRRVYDLYRPPLDRAPDPVAAVLVVVDAANEFLGARVDPIEAAREIPTACGLVAWSAVEQIARLVEVFRAHGWPVVFTVPDWTLQQAVGTATAGPTRAVHDGFGEMPAELTPRPDEPVFARSKPSAFFGSALVSTLVRWGRADVIVVGGTTSGCVRASVVDASSWGFDVTLVDDACFDRSRLSHAVTLFELERKYATIRRADALIGELQSAPRS